MGVVPGQRLSASCGLLLGATLGVLTLLPGCGPQQEERQDARQDSRQDEVTVVQWDWLQQTKQRLDEQRERLAQLEAARLGEKTESGKPPSEELLQLRKEVDDLGEDFNRRLVEYVNANASGAET